jgi:hypothetical protein
VVDRAFKNEGTVRLGEDDFLPVIQVKRIRGGGLRGIYIPGLMPDTWELENVIANFRARM